MEENIRCRHCGYEWKYKGKGVYAHCPRCAYKVLVKQFRKCPYCKSIFAEVYNNKATDPQLFRWKCPGCKKEFPLAKKVSQIELQLAEEYKAEVVY